jgi:AhpD family alkylhydroperoxidase
MPEVAPLADAVAPEAAKKLFQAIQGQFGMVPNIFRTMGHAPAVLESTLGLNAAIQHDLDPVLRELAYLKASQLNNCGYCLHYHKTLGRKAGLTPTQVEDLEQYEKSGAYTEIQKLALKFAEQWTRQGKVSAEVMKKLAGALTPTQLVTLAATVGLANWTNRFNESFGVELP